MYDSFPSGPIVLVLTFQYFIWVQHKLKNNVRISPLPAAPQLWYSTQVKHSLDGFNTAWHLKYSCSFHMWSDILGMDLGAQAQLPNVWACLKCQHYYPSHCDWSDKHTKQLYSSPSHPDSISLLLLQHKATTVAHWVAKLSTSSLVI